MLKSMKLATLLLALSLTSALAELNGTLRIGVMNDNDVASASGSNNGGYKR